jgi:hypothetical protein
MVKSTSGNIVACGASQSASTSQGTLSTASFTETTFANWGATVVADQTPLLTARPNTVFDAADSPIDFYSDNQTGFAKFYHASSTASTSLGILPSNKRVVALHHSDGSYIVLAALDLGPAMGSLLGTRGQISSAGAWTSNTNDTAFTVPLPSPPADSPISDPIILPSQIVGVDAEVFVTVGGALLHYQIKTDNSVVAAAVPDSNSANSGVTTVSAVKVRIPSP